MFMDPFHTDPAAEADRQWYCIWKFDIIVRHDKKISRNELLHSRSGGGKMNFRLKSLTVHNCCCSDAWPWSGNWFGSNVSADSESSILEKMLSSKLKSVVIILLIIL